MTVSCKSPFENHSQGCAFLKGPGEEGQQGKEGESFGLLQWKKPNAKVQFPVGGCEL